MRKHVLITGGTGGIGSALVRAFAEKGYAVSFTYNSSSDASMLAEETRATAFSVDFENVGSLLSFSEKLIREVGGVDVLINNAGVAHYGLIQDVTPDDFHRLFSVNFEAPFFLTRSFVPSMIARQNGTVINIGSVWGETGASCEVLYSATKGAMLAFTKALAKELAPSGIAVNCISPGVVDAGMMSRFSKEEKELIAQDIPSGAFVDPAEIAKLALYLAENSSVSLTGQVLGVNGGMYC